VQRRFAAATDTCNFAITVPLADEIGFALTATNRLDEFLRRAVEITSARHRRGTGG